MAVLWYEQDTLAVAKGLTYFGTATENGELSDTQYTAILDNSTEFGQLTPANAQKWDSTEPSQGVFTFTKGDVVPARAKANGQLLRCHTLVWYSQLPSWVSAGTWTNATLTEVMKNHITKVMTQYKGQCYAWDVVNEAFNEDGTYRESIGPEYIPIAFQTASEVDPDAKLYYNDFNIESSGAKSTAALNVVKDLKAKSIRIDGVGMQAHFIVGSTPSLSAQTTNLDSFTAQGVEVAYTELDIRHSSVPASAAQLATQADDYANTVSACLAVTGCIGITIWDFTDKYSWVPSAFSGAGEALPYNEDFSKKPAYAAIVKVLGGAATGAATKVVDAAVPTSVVSSTAVPVISANSTVLSSTAAASTKDSCKSKAATTLSTAVSQVTSAVAVPTTTPSTNSTTPATGTVAKYYQCGGTGYTGSTSCVAGTTCTVQNEFYSQCL
ncbi:putative endo-1,4-beta-xylanase [Glarea lozoyensis 74030]|uniref:Beta-xylanase n=1 Tax=Glarea lozoyensis (strain ATCC 74030 / MF5533) TaxID=1104152 RepID=H0EWL0_GLAL7|nr:putative endo-1,4-beta-xylanase [Glarea lozoyensis 74030]